MKNFSPHHCFTAFFFSLPTYAFEIWENEDDYKFAFGLEISFQWFHLL